MADEPRRSNLVPALIGCGCGTISFLGCVLLVPPLLIGTSWAVWESGYRVVDASAAVPGGVGIGLVSALIVAPIVAILGFVAGRLVF